jgi:hypothetical protein
MKQVSWAAVVVNDNWMWARAACVHVGSCFTADFIVIGAAASANSSLCNKVLPLLLPGAALPCNFLALCWFKLYSATAFDS